ncbi:MAG: 3,4-dioxygenase subunit beta [Actinobacteria bacterium]|nr:3,4-dioxygenase subunit beta [Actinomycetota bacterium]
MARDLPRFLGRRRALGMLAGGALAAGLAACGSSSSDSSSTTAAAASGSTSSSDTSSGSDTTASSTSSDGTTEIPEETAGPYPGDGSNGPDVLEQSGVVRQDIRSSFGDSTTTVDGVELTMNLKLIDVAGGGGPLAGAAVYLWHCTADGLYSMYSNGATNENYLRGVQVSDDEGNLSFTTIFPGAYMGRYPHMHFEVYPSVDDATSASNKLVTSQLAMPSDSCEEVYATTGYEQSATNFPRTPIDQDGIFRDGYSSQMTTITGDISSGLTGTLNIGV